MRLATATPALGQVEIGGECLRESAGDTLTVVERLRHGGAMAATLAGQAPDVVLLSTSENQPPRFRKTRQGCRRT